MACSVHVDLDWMVFQWASMAVQHTINSAIRVPRHDELCKIGELQPVVGDSERFGGAAEGSRGCSEVENGHLAHFVRRWWSVWSERKKP